MLYECERCMIEFDLEIIDRRILCTPTCPLCSSKHDVIEIGSSENALN